MGEDTARDVRRFVYCIDSRDHITAVNDPWREFAIENGAAGLAHDTVVGRSLWSYVADSETLHLYQQMLRRLRTNRQSIRVPFRCDAPALRRYMELEMTVANDDSVCFTAEIVRLEPRAPVALLDDSHRRRDGLLRMCSWCKKVELDDKTWADVEEAVKRLRIFEQARLPHITHGMCDACFARLHPLGEDD